MRDLAVSFETNMSYIDVQRWLLYVCEVMSTLLLLSHRIYWLWMSFYGATDDPCCFGTDPSVSTVTLVSCLILSILWFPLNYLKFCVVNTEHRRYFNTNCFLVNAGCTRSRVDIMVLLNMPLFWCTAKH